MGKAREFIGTARMKFLYMSKEEGNPVNYYQGDLEDDLKTIENFEVVD